MRVRFVLRSPDDDVVVRDVADGRWAEPSGEANAIIGETMWALPGLVDAHAHLASADLDYQPGDLPGAVERAKEALEAGVTLVLDKGWCDEVTIEMMDVVEQHDRPEIEAAARIIAAPGGYYPDFGIEVPPGEIEKAVRDQAQAAVGWVKLIGDWPRRGLGPRANFDEAELRSAVEVAESVGARVAIHTMAREVPSLAVAAGVHSIEHGLFLEETDLDALGRRSGMWVPTLLRCEMTLADLGSGSSGGKLFVEGLSRLRRLIPLAVEAGVNVLAGTDLVGSPANVAEEALRLRDYGLSDRQMVDAVSIAAFSATGRSTTFDLGAPADAIFFGENPVASPEVLRHPAQIVRLGRPR